MALLTGPNMAGKSTVLRSMCAVALLGACGLYAPAASATVPYFGKRCPLMLEICSLLCLAF